MTRIVRAIGAFLVHPWGARSTGLPLATGYDVSCRRTRGQGLVRMNETMHRMYLVQKEYAGRSRPPVPPCAHIAHCGKPPWGKLRPNPPFLNRIAYNTNSSGKVTDIS